MSALAAEHGHIAVPKGVAVKTVVMVNALHCLPVDKLANGDDGQAPAALVRTRLGGYGRGVLLERPGELGWLINNTAYGEPPDADTVEDGETNELDTQVTFTPCLMEGIEGQGV